MVPLPKISAVKSLSEMLFSQDSECVRKDKSKTLKLYKTFHSPLLFVLVGILEIEVMDSSKIATPTHAQDAWRSAIT